MRLRFPITGHDLGPGGRLSAFRCLRRRLRSKTRGASQAAMYVTQVGGSIVSNGGFVTVETGVCST